MMRQKISGVSCVGEDKSCSQLSLICNRYGSGGVSKLQKMRSRSSQFLNVFSDERKSSPGGAAFSCSDSPAVRVAWGHSFSLLLGSNIYRWGEPLLDASFPRSVVECSLSYLLLIAFVCSHGSAAFQRQP